ncbi:hypothetical protein ACA910_008258 [Epithemia clementina (nom. ined.)]
MSAEAATTTTTSSSSNNNNDDDGEATSIDIAANVELVRANIEKALLEARTNDEPSVAPAVRLVAVSKTKPIALLRQAYDEAGVRVFGENYVQEMVDKVPQMPSDVQWHFIGTLQSNKVGLLLSPFLLPKANGGADEANNNAAVAATTSSSLDRLVLETVSTLKLARKLQKAIEDAAPSTSHDNTASSSSSPPQPRLKIFVQVNTSGEDSKSGVSPSEVVALCRDIVQECPALQLLGLMTIGAPGDETCLDTLVQCRQEVEDALSLPHILELSMGMSGDYELAIAKGSTNVRVGSTIFGARDYSNVTPKK